MELNVNESNKCKLIENIPCRYYYMQIRLEFIERPQLVISSEAFQSLIVQNIEQLFGENGASIPIDLLKYNKNTFDAIIRIPKKSLNKIWSSLTSCRSYGKNNCAFRVIKISPFLVSLAANSRIFIHE